MQNKANSTLLILVILRVMHSFFGLLFATLIFLQPVSKAAIFISFKLNQEYIAKNLCENKDKPKMHCNGNCQLMKDLKKAEKQEQKNVPFELKESSESVYYQALISYEFLKETLEFLNSKSFFYQLEKRPSDYLSNIFHPPQSI